MTLDKCLVQDTRLQTRPRNQVSHTKRSRLTVQQLAEDFVFRTTPLCLLTPRGLISVRWQQLHVMFLAKP
jgi:hypothetical protein